MAEAIASVLGWCVLLFGAGALGLFVVRRARVHGVLVPVVVGLALRLVVMLIAHAGSVSLGDHGILVLDDQTYLRGGTRLAEFWRQGATPDPARVEILGTYQFGYQIFLGVLFTLGTPSILLGKFVNVLLGAATILGVALLGGRLLGERAKLRAAWIAALAPSLIWWSAPLLKEVIATLLMVLGLLAVTYLPQARAVAGLAAILAFLLILRGPEALALMVGTGVGVALAGRKAKGRWLSRPFVVLLGALAAGVVVVAAVVSHGQLHALYQQYDLVVNRMIGMYQGGNPARVPYDAVKSLLTPLPWVFDRGTENWDRALYPGVFLIMCALPLAALGAWRLRRKPEAWAMLAAAATALTINAFTSGYVFRQRSMIEPIVLLLALGGATSWRMAGQVASATLAALGAVAGIHTGSPLTAAVILAAAVALFLLSRRFSSRKFQPLPDSAMTVSFQVGRVQRPPERGPRALVRTARRALSRSRTMVASAAPQIEAEPAPAREHDRPQRLRRALLGVTPPLVRDEDGSG